MNARPFLDTNILIYAFASNDPRSETAEALVAAGGVISVQVLNEFVSVSRRKLRRDWTEITTAIGVLRTLLDTPLPLTVAIHDAAVELARRHGLAFYDGLVVAAAKQAKCRILCSEDMQDGQVIDAVTIRNPFAASVTS
jgi:predicted nucleic acid-binding protein